MNKIMFKTKLRKLILATSAKLVSAIGLITLQLIISRTDGENAVGNFSAMLSVFFLVGVISRWGAAELMFKDSRIILRENGYNYLNRYFLLISKNTFFRSILVTISILILNYVALPVLGLKSFLILDQIWYLAIAPFFALTIINANRLHILNKNFLAGWCEPGGLAFTTSITVILLMPLHTATFVSFSTISVFAYATVVITALPVLSLLISGFNETKPKVREQLNSSEFFLSSIFIYAGQWGIIAILAALESPRIAGIFAICLQLSVALNFIMRVCNSLYSHRIRVLYETKPIKEFIGQYHMVSKLIGTLSIFVFSILVLSSDIIYETFHITDPIFYFIFYVLTVARFVNNLFGMTDLFLNMTYYQREYLWIIIISNSIAVAAAVSAPLTSIEIVASGVAASIVVRNILCSCFIYWRCGIIMLPFLTKGIK